MKSATDGSTPAVFPKDEKSMVDYQFPEGT